MRYPSSGCDLFSGGDMNDLQQAPGFSMLELVTVLALVLILAALTWPALLGLIEAGRATHALGQLSMALENARWRATADGTYVWLGFAEENVGSTRSARLVLSSVASRDGTRIFNPNASASATNKLDAARLVQVGKLLRLEQTRLADVPEPSGTGGPFEVRPSVKRGPVTYRIGASTPAPSRFPFQYPVGAPVPVAQYLFAKTLQFNPRGQVVINGSYSFVPWLEVAIVPARFVRSGRESVVQVAGLTGNVRLYRR